MKYDSTVCIQFGELKHVLGWCEKYCHDKWSFNESTQLPLPFTNNKPYFIYNFTFDSQDDALVFKLTHENY